MNILSVENFNGYFTSQTSLWGSFHSTCDRLTYNFTPGVYVLSGEIDSGGWAFAASLYPQSSKNTIIFPHDTTLYYMGKKASLKEIQKYACNLDDASTGRIKELLLKSSVKKRVEQGIKKNRLDCTAEDIRKLFLIASERYDRPLNQVGIDLFSCNAAINLVNRKMIYCFPWLSQKHFPYCKVKIEKICRVLSDYGKLVLLPVSNQVNGLEKYNIIEFPRPLE